MNTRCAVPDTPEFKDLKEALPKALYWRIVKFTGRFTAYT